MPSYLEARQDELPLQTDLSRASGILQSTRARKCAKKIACQVALITSQVSVSGYAHSLVAAVNKMVFAFDFVQQPYCCSSLAWLGVLLLIVGVGFVAYFS